jgi:hypothetical protein
MDFDEVLRGLTDDPNATKVLESVVESTDFNHFKTALVALLVIIAHNLLKDFGTYVVPRIITLLRGKDIQKET